MPGTTESDLDKSEEGQSLILGRIQGRIDLDRIFSPKCMVSRGAVFRC